MTIIGRNELCPCCSGKKYKKCCESIVNKHGMMLSETRKKFGFFRFGSEFREIILKLEHPDEYEKLKQRRKNHVRSIEKTSGNLFLGQSVIDDETRQQLLDVIAEVLDNNDPLGAGRHEMCMHFAILLSETLNYAGYHSDVVWGIVRYYNSNDLSKSFGLHHAWVEMENEIIDGNADSLKDNPIIDPVLGISPEAFWGRKTELPKNRTIFSRNILSSENRLELEIDDELNVYTEPLELAMSSNNIYQKILRKRP